MNYSKNISNRLSRMEKMEKSEQKAEASEKPLLKKAASKSSPKR